MRENRIKIILSVIVAMTIISSSIVIIMYKNIVELKKNEVVYTTQMEQLGNNIVILRGENDMLKQQNTQLQQNNGELKKSVNDMLRIPEWNVNNVTSKSNVSVIGLKLALKDTNLKGHEQVFIEAEETFGINAIFLTSLVALESGWGTSARSKSQNNLTGFAVYNDVSRGASFRSWDDCILATARLLKEDYINNSLLSVYSINDKYSTSSSWKGKISSIANDLVVKANVNNYTSKNN